MTEKVDGLEQHGKNDADRGQNGNGRSGNQRDPDIVLDPVARAQGRADFAERQQETGKHQSEDTANQHPIDKVAGAIERVGRIDHRLVDILGKRDPFFCHGRANGNQPGAQLGRFFPGQQVKAVGNVGDHTLHQGLAGFMLLEFLFVFTDFRFLGVCLTRNSGHLQFAGAGISLAQLAVDDRLGVERLEQEECHHEENGRNGRPDKDVGSVVTGAGMKRSDISINNTDSAIAPQHGANNGDDENGCQQP